MRRRFAIMPVLLGLIFLLAALNQQVSAQVPKGASEGVIDATVVFTQTIQTPASDAPAPISEEQLNKGGFFTPILEVDNGGNIFAGYIRNDGLTAQGRVIRRNPAGVTTGSWQVNVGSINGIAHKADGLAGVISGDDLLLSLTSHATNEGPRIMALWGASIDNVAVPYPNGVRPTGAPGGNVGQGTTQTGCDDCPSLAQISALIDAKNAQLLTTIRNEFGGNVRQGIEDKTKDAITELGVLRLGSSEADRYAMLRRDTRDGAFEAFKSWYGPSGTPTPTR